MGVTVIEDGRPSAPASASADVRTARRVTIGDLANFHRSGRTCLCRGAAELTVHKNGAATFRHCEKALREFAAATRGRVTQTPDGAAWKVGCDPDTWAFTLMFISSMRSTILDARMRRHYAVDEAGRWVLKQ